MTHSNSQSSVFFGRQWQAAEDMPVAGIQQQWLLDAGSMTAKLKTLGRLSVTPLQETEITLADEEARFLSRTPGEAAHLRTVLLCVDTQPVIFARSVFPLSSLGGDNRILETLHERPLGSELFRFPEAQRQRIDGGWLPASQLPKVAGVTKSTPLLARRSLFFKYQHPLLVAECFLPALWQALL